MVLVVFLSLMVIAGLAVDGGAQVRATQYADMVAGESARAGAQRLDPGTTTGQAPALDGYAAAERAQTYMGEFDSSAYGKVTGTCQAQDTTVTCETTVVYHTIFLGIIGIDTLTVHGHGQAQGTRTVDGQPR